MKYAYQGKEIYPTVEIYPDVIPYLGGVTDNQFYTDPALCIHAWREGIAAIKDYFGEFASLLTLTKSPRASLFSLVKYIIPSISGA